MMTGHQGPSQGDEFYKKAEGKITGWFSKDFEAAYENFMKAGAAYKVENNWTRAGEAFMRAGDCAIKEKNSMEACQAYTESANTFKKVDMVKASAAIQAAISLNIEANRLVSAAKLEKDFAEGLENEGKLAEAIPHYQKAHDYYYAEDQTQSAMTCLAKIAKIYGETDQFAAAIPLLEQIGRAYAGGPLKHQAKEFFLRAVLCRCALITPENRTEKAAETIEAFESYVGIDPQMRHTREEEFCSLLLEAEEESEIEKLDEAVAMLDEYRLLDDWKTHVLLICKRNFENIR